MFWVGLLNVKTSSSTNQEFDSYFITIEFFPLILPIHLCFFLSYTDNIDICKYIFDCVLSFTLHYIPSHLLFFSFLLQILPLIIFHLWPILVNKRHNKQGKAPRSKCLIFSSFFYITFLTAQSNLRTRDFKKLSFANILYTKQIYLYHNSF